MEDHCNRLDCVDEGSRGTPNGIAIKGFDPWLDAEGPIVGVSAKPITESGKIDAHRPSDNGLQVPPLAAVQLGFAPSVAGALWVRFASNSVPDRIVLRTNMSG